MRFGLALMLGAVVLVGGCTGEEPPGFNADVRPLLNDRCLACHGGVKQSGGFSLLFPEQALDTTDAGRRALVPGRPGRSEMIRRVAHSDPHERMPPEGPPLTGEEVELLRRWVAAGAAWEAPWAFVPAERPAVPEVDSAAWVRRGLDAFVLARLEAEGVAPSAEASCAVLVRRVSLDLVGLPPKAGAVAEVCGDGGGAVEEGSYGSYVDGLLASPRFGERWAGVWLDLARYADTKGYERDPHRDMWRYRDWLIGAFNGDVPFDRFTVEQLAGDLLPGATDEQLLATAFHRNTMTNTEGGTKDEEFRIAAIVDRVNTTMEVWQGVTMACVQCHAHPYDPIRHEEYYGLYAFFNNTDDDDRTDDAPVLKEYTAEVAAEAEGTLDELHALGVVPQRFRQAALSERIHAALYPEGHLKPSAYNAAQSVYSESEWLQPRAAGSFVRFDSLDLTHVDAIEFGLRAGKAGGTIDIVLDSLDGPTVGRLDVAPTSGMEAARVPVAAPPGAHDVYFVFDRDGLEGGYTLSWIYLDRAEPGFDAEMRERVGRLRLQLANLPAEHETPILRERPAERRRETRFLERGNWLTPRDPVAPGVPASLGSMPEGEPPDRLAFARWLVSDENPLTARVTVNRFWGHLFGVGLVSTPDDFGTQGEPPSHPDLLDYLAVTFREDDGWSVKKLLRRIVTSATYRQSSAVRPELQAVDPQNRLLARGPRVRLSAEQVRDQALAVAGLLSDKMYGPSVMPPQPPGVWASPYSSATWTESEAEDRHRRALYTYWKRTAPYPSMISFDAPTREVCVSRRVRTNTPLQALVLLNDPVYVEAAQHLGERMRTEVGTDLDDQLHYGYRLALAEEPPAAVLADLRALHADALKQYEADPEAAVTFAGLDDEASPDEALAAAERAAFTTVASALLNLDRFVTKE